MIVSHAIKKKRLLTRLNQQAVTLIVNWDNVFPLSAFKKWTPQGFLQEQQICGAGQTDFYHALWLHSYQKSSSEVIHLY